MSVSYFSSITSYVICWIIAVTFSSLISDAALIINSSVLSLNWLNTDGCIPWRICIIAFLAKLVSSTNSFMHYIYVYNSITYYNSVYLSLLPLAFATGYFASFWLIFIFTISSASNPSLSNRFWLYTITSASSSLTCCKS